MEMTDSEHNARLSSSCARIQASHQTTIVNCSFSKLSAAAQGLTKVVHHQQANHEAQDYFYHLGDAALMRMQALCAPELPARWPCKELV
jgi:hypothetical protein